MKPFDAAYVRMTAWYVVIIMTISLLFSAWVFNQAHNELRTGLSRVIELKPLIVDYKQTDPNYSGVLSGELNNSRGRLLSRLVLMNVVVLVVGSVASYALARRTMRPIEESMEAQERFTADASHELRTPLAAMKAEIEVGLRQGKSLTKDEAVGLLKSNLEEIDRMQSLADGMLTLTQTSVPTLVPLQLQDVAEKVIKRMQPIADDKQITVIANLKPFQVQGDETTVDTIAGILLDNAIKYSSANSKVTVETYQKDGQGFLAVDDEGVGIKASELPHIFERFYRADISRSKLHVAGHGLGLSIAKKLAEQIDARLSATSTPGKGSRFVLCLPLSTT